MSKNKKQAPRRLSDADLARLRRLDKAGQQALEQMRRELGRIDIEPVSASDDRALDKVWATVTDAELAASLAVLDDK